MFARMQTRPVSYGIDSPPPTCSPLERALLFPYLFPHFPTIPPRSALVVSACTDTFDSS